MKKFVPISLAVAAFLFVGTRWLRSQGDAAAAQQEIKIYSMIDQSAGLASEGKRMVEGLNLAIKNINKAGGIKGKKIKLVEVFDDSYDPAKTKPFVNKLIAEGKPIIISPLGSPTTASYMDAIKDKKLFVLAPFSGSPAIRKEHPHIVHMMPDYNAMELVLFKLAKGQGLNKFAFFAQGDEVTEGVKKIIADAGIKADEHIFVPYERNTTDFSKQKKQIEEYKPQAIILLTTVAAATAFLRQLGAENLVGKKLFSIQLGDTKFKQFLGQQGIEKQVTDMQSVPNPEKSDLALVKEYREAMGTKKPDPFSFWTYWAVKLFEAIAKTIDGEVTADSLAEAAKKLDVDLGGIKMKYDAKGPNLMPFVFMDDGQGGDWKMTEVK